MPWPAEYLRALDDSAAHKVGLFAPWIDALSAAAGERVVDAGCGTGALVAALARGRPQLQWLGLDADTEMLAQARLRHGHTPALSFAAGDARNAAAGPARAWLLSSVLHEVHAAGGAAAVRQALQHAAAQLLPGGRLVLRDFVRPPDAARRVRLAHRHDDRAAGRGFVDLARAAHFALRLDAWHDGTEVQVVHTDVEGAFEFLFRKDCGAAWTSELGQRYAFWTADEAVDWVEAAGLQLRHRAVEVNRWVLQHRVQGRAALSDAATGAPLEPALTQILLVADKPAGLGADKPAGLGANKPAAVSLTRS